MMPVGTPPNTIVFGSGFVTIPQMAKAGFWLNIIGVVVVTSVLYLIVVPMIGTLRSIATGFRGVRRTAQEIPALPHRARN